MRIVAGKIPGTEAWQVIDARTGLPVPLVNWADDATHEIGVWSADACPIARVISGESPTPQYVPKVVIDVERRTVLIHVKEELAQDHTEVYAAAPQPAKKEEVTS